MPYCLRRRGQFPALLFALVAAWLTSSAAAWAEKPACALVDTSKLPVISLLEARLLTTPGASWVERKEIERLLGERELQAAFGAEGVKSRSSLGALLKADVLVLLRAAKPDPKDKQVRLECVICETKRGLRLRMATLTTTENQEETAAALAEVVQQGLKKFAERIEAVVAVPPFLSDDLGLEFNYLQTAYAKIVEQQLLEQPGVLVVELGEAQAIAKELLLDPAADTLQSSAPFYWNGRYRHDGAGQDRTLRIGMKLLRADAELGQKGVKDLSPAAAASWILASTSEFLPLLKTKSPGAPKTTPTEEARKLAERGRQFQKSGSWSEALTLYEASLLFDPNQESVHRSAVAASASVLQSLYPCNTDVEKANLALARYQRGLEHLEAYMRTAPSQLGSPSFAAETQLVSSFSGAGGRLWLPEPRSPAEFLAIAERAKASQSEVYLRIARFRAQENRHDFTGWDAAAVWSLPEPERLALTQTLIEEWSERDDLADRIERMLAGTSLALEETPALKKFLAELQQSKNPRVLLGLEKLEGRRQRARTHEAKVAAQKIPEVSTKLDPNLEEITFQGPEGKPVNFVSWLAGGSELDFLTGKVLFAVGKTGSVRPLYEYPKLNFRVESAVFDGRFIWLAARDINELMLVVVDSTNGKYWTFTANDGLPDLKDPESRLKLAAVAPGKACVVGVAGHSWVALAEIDAVGTRTVSVFFEARETVANSDREESENVHGVFIPDEVATLRQGDAAACRVLVKRTRRGGSYRRPLVIDPLAKAVVVAPYEIPRDANPELRTVADGAYYCFASAGPKEPYRLLRVKYPGEAIEEFLPNSPDGWLVAGRGELYIVGTQWRKVNLKTGAITSLAREVPWYFNSREKLLPGGINPEFGVDVNAYSRIQAVYASAQFGPLVKTMKQGETKYWRLKPPASVESPSTPKANS